MYIDETSVKFNTNNMTLSGARLHLGKSDLTLSGELSDIRRAMLRGGKLKANFELESDLIDCNQLMLAIGKGLQFSDQLASNSVGEATESTCDRCLFALRVVCVRLRKVSPAAIRRSRC